MKKFKNDKEVVITNNKKSYSRKIKLDNKPLELISEKCKEKEEAINTLCDGNYVTYMNDKNEKIIGIFKKFGDKTLKEVITYSKVILSDKPNKFNYFLVGSCTEEAFLDNVRVATKEEILLINSLFSSSYNVCWNSEIKDWVSIKNRFCKTKNILVFKENGKVNIGSIFEKYEDNGKLNIIVDKAIIDIESNDEPVVIKEKTLFKNVNIERKASKLEISILNKLTNDSIKEDCVETIDNLLKDLPNFLIYIESSNKKIKYRFNLDAVSSKIGYLNLENNEYIYYVDYSNSDITTALKKLREQIKDFA